MRMSSGWIRSINLPTVHCKRLLLAGVALALLAAGAAAYLYKPPLPGDAGRPGDLDDKQFDRKPGRGTRVMAGAMSTMSNSCFSVSPAR